MDYYFQEKEAMGQVFFYTEASIWHDGFLF